MDLHSFEIDKLKFVSGLFWQPISGSSSSERSKDVVTLAEEMGFDLHVMRISPTYSVGYTSSRLLKGGGWLSAAAVVSKTLEIEGEVRDFIFVSCLPDGQWIYVAQRDGVILPDGDACFPTEDAARSRLLSDLSIGSWSLIFAPAIWGIDNAEERDFISFLPQKEKGRRHLHKWWKLTPVNTRYALAQSWKLLLLLVVFIGAAVALYMYKQQQDRQAEELRRLQELAMQGQGPAAPEHPWKKAPLPLSIAKNCLNALSKENLFPGNWSLVSVTCNDKLLNISWSPTAYGFIDHIQAVNPKIILSQDGNLANLVVPLPELETGYNEALMAPRDRMLGMYSAAQKYSFVIILTPAPPPPPPLPGQEPVNQIKLDWSEIKWRVDSTSSPEVVLAALGANGFRLSTMTARWVEGRFVWNLEGVQYVLP